MERLGPLWRRFLEPVLRAAPRCCLRAAVSAELRECPFRVDRKHSSHGTIWSMNCRDWLFRRRKMVGADVVLIDRLLRLPHAEQAGMGGQIIARFRRNRRQMVNPGQLHRIFLARH